MTSSECLRVDGLGRHFGTRVVLRDVSLQLDQGEILALFGPNGVGKTTLLRILATLLRPSKGRVVLNDLDLSLRSQRDSIRRQIGFLSHRPMVYSQLTARENLEFYARVYGVSSHAQRSAHLLRQVGLSGREEDRVRHYSRGMQQRLAIARGLIHDPQLLLLDEPFSGLDPEASQFLRNLLREEAARGKSVLLTTHDVEAGLKVCDRAAVLSRGCLTLDRPRHQLDPQDLTAALRKDTAPTGTRS